MSNAPTWSKYVQHQQLDSTWSTLCNFPIKPIITVALMFSYQPQCMYEQRLNRFIMEAYKDCWIGFCQSGIAGLVFFKEWKQCHIHTNFHPIHLHHCVECLTWVSTFMLENQCPKNSTMSLTFLACKNVNLWYIVPIQCFCCRYAEHQAIALIYSLNVCTLIVPNATYINECVLWIICVANFTPHLLHTTRTCVNWFNSKFEAEQCDLLQIIRSGSNVLRT